MAHEPYRVLLIEQPVEEGRSVAPALAGAGDQFDLHRAGDLAGALSRLERAAYDALLLDLRLPDGEGLAALARVTACSERAAIVVLADPSDELLALKAVQAGADDYLLRSQVYDTALIRSLRHAIEKRRMTAQLRTSREQIQLQATLLDAVGEAVIGTDPDGAISYWNAAAERLYGWSAAEAMGRNVIDVTVPAPSDSQAAAIMEALSRGESWTGEFEVQRRDGRRFLALVTDAPIRDGGGEVVGIVGVSVDISERQRAEQALRESDERFRLVARATNEVIWDSDPAADRTWYSEQAESMFRCPASSLPSTFEACIETVHPDDRAAFLAAYDEALREGREMFTHEYRFRRGDGSYVHLLARGYIRYEDGRAVRIAGSLQDLTERRRAEAAVRESEERFRTLFETMAQGVIYMDAEGRFLQMNAAARTLLGVGEDQVGERTAFDADWRPLRGDGTPMPPEELPTPRALRTGREVNEAVLGVWNAKEGRHRWLLVHARPQYRAGAERPYQTYSTYTDITALRETEIALKESQERLNWILETVTDAIVIVDGDGRITFGNRAAEDLLGLAPSRLATRTFDDPAWRITAVDGGPFPAAELPAARVLATGAPVYGVEHGIEWPDGRRVVLSINAAPLHDAGGGLAGVVATIRDVTASLESARRMRFQATLLDAVGESVAATDLDGRIIYWNRQSERLLGWSADEVLGRRIMEVISVPGEGEEIAGLLGSVAAGEPWSGELELSHRDGSRIPVFVSGAPILNDAGEVVGLVGASTDLRQVRRLEEQLQQAQRMEAVGRLAGGVAHDFNNILTAIQGYADFLADEIRPGDPLRGDVEEIRVAADRAASLTRQLLAFSRRQMLQPRVLDLRAVVEGMRNMLGRLIGEDVKLELEAPATLGPVRADPGQVEQVIMNLAVNARDAMPDGGTIRLALREADVSGRDGRELTAGRYVVLGVSDTGHGISPAIMSHIFEPFFTTKQLGKGTGLGLSTVYGIIKQSGGHIEVRSSPDEGTAFDIYLPRVDGEVAVARSRPAGAAASGRGETVLLVEDEDALRALAARVLVRLGYSVLQAATGDEALRVAAAADRAPDLLLTDVVMPEMSGRDLAERLREDRPDLKVLFMSGYTEDIISRHGVLEEGHAFLEKPFAPAALGARVRELLDGQDATPDS